MRINIVGKSDAPGPPYTEEVTDFNIPAVPFALGALWLRSQKYWWIDSDAWRNGRNLCNQLAVSLLMPSGQAIVNAIDRVAIRIDGAMRGQSYDIASGTGIASDPYVYSPGLSQTIDPNNFGSPGVMRALEYLNRLLENSQHGIGNAEFSDNRNYRQQLDDLIAAVNSGSADNDEILSTLISILGAL